MKKNKTQELQFLLMQNNSFHQFDGDRVVADLKRCHELWHGAILSRDTCPLMMLRDIQYDQWNASVLYILATGKDNVKLRKIAKQWGASEIRWIKGDEAGKLLGSYPPQGDILELWWD